ncbi:MAG: hypothetical protein HC836_34755 [Richelia sp. RM2_1_2]|nr:hypothetical protein [Richelia sp. RM2_1_2]
MQQVYRSTFTGLLIGGLVLSAFSPLSAVAGNSKTNRQVGSKTSVANVLRITSNALPSPKLTFVGKEPYTVRGKQFYRYKLAVTNSDVYPDNLFSPAPNLPPCGNNTNSSRTWVNIFNAQTNSRLYGFCALSSPKNLTSLWFAVEKGQNPPKSVYITLEDRQTNKTYRSNVVLLKEEQNPPQATKEDCLAFNPNNIAVKKVNNSWKIIEGSNHWMFDFGNKRDEALSAYKTIKHYGMNKSCFVGRPDPSFKYLLVNNRAPVGSLQGEDCVAFDPNRTTVRNVNGRWTIVDGNHLMFNFGSNKDEALESLKIIKKYNFTRSCFVGRPDPSFSYLRR